MSTPNRRPVPPRPTDAIPGTRHDPKVSGNQCVSQAFIDGIERTCERAASHNNRSGERQHHGDGRRWETQGNNAPATVIQTCLDNCVCRTPGRAWT